MGTLGDLGTSFQFQHPFPEEDMKKCFKKYTKKSVTEAISLVNARELDDSRVFCYNLYYFIARRTPTFDVHSAWNVS